MASKYIKQCPICGRPAIDPASKIYPFCSERCQLTDLGNWASENYVAHSPLSEADEILDSFEQPEEND